MPAVEVHATEVDVLNPCLPLPFPVAPVVTVIHGTALVAVYVQPVGTVTAT